MGMNGAGGAVRDDHLEAHTGSRGRQEMEMLSWLVWKSDVHGCFCSPCPRLQALQLTVGYTGREWPWIQLPLAPGTEPSPGSETPVLEKCWGGCEHCSLKVRQVMSPASQCGDPPG